MPAGPHRAECVRLVHRCFSILWILQARGRSSRFWEKVDLYWSALNSSFYDNPVRGWGSGFILYWFASFWSTWQYGGETGDADRRAGEYVSRVMQGKNCVSPQPFFDIIHENSTSTREIAWRLSHWTLVPVARGESVRSARLWQENHMIKTLQMKLTPRWFTP